MAIAYASRRGCVVATRPSRRLRQVDRRPSLEDLEDRCLLAIPTTINFDALAPGTAIVGQYHAQGVDFTPLTVGSTRYYPIVAEPPAGQPMSGPNVAGLFGPGSPPVPDLVAPVIAGTFTTYHRTVSVGVGAFAVPGTDTNAVRLRVYDRNHALIATVGPQTVTDGAGFRTVLTATATQANIFSFEVYADPTTDRGDSLGIDNLTFDTTATAPDFTVLAPYAVFVGRGHATTTRIATLPINGATGNYTYSAASLPAGVTASFAPNPSGTGTTLTLTATATAPYVNEDSVVIVATPQVGTAGPGTRSATIKVSVKPDFWLGRTSTTTPVLRGFETVTVPVTVSRMPYFLTPTIGLSVSGAPAGVTASISPSSVGTPPGGGTVNIATLTLRATGAELSTSFSVVVTASQGTATNRLTIPITGVPIRVTSVTPTAGWAPIRLGVGTDILVRGTGLQAIRNVEFGNTAARVAPRWVNAAGTELRVRVPRLATDGRIRLLNAAGNAVTAPGTFDASTFRNTHGHSFSNFSKGGVDWDEVYDLFGDRQCHVWLFGAIDTGIPDPFALLFWAIADEGLDGGRCFGMSLSSQRLVLGQKAYTAFAAQPGLTATSVWNLRGPDAAGGPSSSLRHYVNYQHVAQLSAQYMHDVLVQTDDGGNIANRVRNILATGRDALISMQDDSGGHNVVGYNLRDDGSGGYWIDVYDNNRPFLTSENTSATSHSGREDASRIHITAAGNWEFGAVGWSGGPRSIIITKATDIPVTPTMPTSLAGLLTIIFGDAAKAAQVTDSAGRTLINPDGSPNIGKDGVPDGTVFYPTGPARTVRPIVLLGGTDTYTQTVVGTAAGTYDAALMGRGFAAKVEGVQTARGITDTLTLVPNRTGVQFATGSASTKAMLRVNARTSAGVPRNAALGTTTVKGGGETVAFDAERQALTYTHKGAAADYTLTLDSFDASGKATKFVSPKLRIQPGDRAVFRPTDWNRLKDADVTLDVTDSKGQTKHYVLRSV